MAMYPTQLFQLVVCLLVYLMDKWEIVKFGHLNIGAGRTVYQSLTLINKALN